MSAGTPFIFIPAKAKLLKAGFNLPSDALKLALCTNVQALSADFLGASGDARYADLTAEVANGNGYTTGGQALSAAAVNYFVSAATVAAGGSGGTTGVQTVAGTTGAGTKFQASVTIAGGAITGVNSISVSGAYTALPTAPSAEPVTGAGLAGATLNLVMGSYLTATNPSWPNSTYSAKYGVLYDNTSANKDLYLAVDLETTVSTGLSPVAGTLTYNVPALGFFSLV